MRLPADRNLIALVVVLLLATAAYFGVTNSSGYRGGIAELDGYYYYVYLRSVQMDGDLELGNEYQTWGNPFRYGRTATGYHRNVFGVGPAILWSPFFLVAHGLARAGAALGLPLSLDGMSPFHQRITFYGTLLYGWLALLLCYFIVRRVVGKEHALWAVLGAGLAGPLPYYCLTWASYSHAQAAMAASLTVLLWLKWRGEWTVPRWVGLGAAAGLTVLVRPACAPFLLLPMLEGARALWTAARGNPDRRGRAVGRALLGPLAGAASALAVFSPQLVVWKILYGSLLLVPQGEGFMRWTDNVWWSTLFSPRNGLFTVAPLMLIAVLGLVAGIRRAPQLVAPLLLVLAGMLAVNGAAYDWWGWGFSARRFTALLPVFALGLGTALGWARERLGRNPKRTVAWGTALVVIFAIIFNLQWMLNFGQRSMDWYQVRSTEGLYMTVTHSLMERVFDGAGNPLSLPASVPFSIRRGGSPKIYDRIDGSYLLGEFHPDANPAANPLLHSTLDFGDLRFRYNLSDEFGYPVRRDGIRYVPLRQPHGHVFLPLNRPGDLGLELGGRAARPGTRVELRFNGHSLGTRDLLPAVWSVLRLKVPGRLVERGINRLDLLHQIPPEPVPSRCLPPSRGAAPCSSVDLAAVSGGISAGNFAEIWVDGREVTSNQRGLNVAVVESASGRLLGAAAFDVALYPAMYGQLAQYLSFFPRGSLVLLASRGDAHRYFEHGGARALGLLGATGQQITSATGYAALGILGSARGTAREVIADDDHARVHLGIPPVSWREVAHYRILRLH